MSYPLTENGATTEASNQDPTNSLSHSSTLLQPLRNSKTRKCHLYAKKLFRVDKITLRL